MSRKQWQFKADIAAITELLAHNASMPKRKPNTGNGKLEAEFQKNCAAYFAELQAYLEAQAVTMATIVPQIDCETCDGMGMVKASNVTLDDPDFGKFFGKLFPCPHCERGQQIEIKSWQRRVESARLPAGFEKANLASLDPNTPGKELAYWMIHEFAASTDGFVEYSGKRKNSVFVYGDFGIGKTWALAALLHYKLEKGGRVLYTRVDDMMDAIRRDMFKEPTQHLIDLYKHAPILFLDEANMGSAERPARVSDFVGTTMENILRCRCNNLLPVFMTTNLRPAEWLHHWGYVNEVIFERAFTVEMAGERLRELSS